MVLLTPLLLSLLPLAALAHPGEEHEERSPESLAHRSKFIEKSKRSLAGCSSKLRSRDLANSAVQRRADWYAELREARDLHKKEKHRRVRRDLETALSTVHDKTGSVSFTQSTDFSTVFSGNTSCLLEPETTEGPYYVSGELIRNDVVESQAGIPLYADLQFVDVSTCAPVSDLYLDWWHVNATGVYAGIIAQGNGDSGDASNINNTALRGIYGTDSEGVVQFTSIFPGHYSGRATHIHILAHLGGKVLDNGTYSGGTVSHVGQLFFDQDLISEADTVAPYSTNTQSIVLNSEDSILAGAAADEFDPFFEYVLLGEDISDGVFAWVSIAVDTTASRSVSTAAVWTDHGGVANSAGGGGMGGGGPGNGTGMGGNGTGGPPGMSGSLLAPSATLPVNGSTSLSVTVTGGPSTSTAAGTDSTDATSTGTAPSTQTGAAAAGRAKGPAGAASLLALLVAPLMALL